MPTLNTKRVTQTQYDGVQLSSDQESICSNYAVDETGQIFVLKCIYIYIYYIREYSTSFMQMELVDGLQIVVRR